MSITDVYHAGLFVAIAIGVLWSYTILRSAYRVIDMTERVRDDWPSSEEYRMAEAANRWWDGELTVYQLYAEIEKVKGPKTSDERRPQGVERKL